MVGGGEAYEQRLCFHLFRFVFIFQSVLTLFGLPPYLGACNFVCKTLIKPQNASDMKQQEGGKFITKILIFLYVF